MAPLDAYLERLRALPPVRTATVKRARSRDADVETLAVKTVSKTYELAVTHAHRRLSPITAAALLFKRGAPPRRIVMAPLIAGGVARSFVDAGINYVDLVGNCHLVLDREVYVHVEGNRAPRAAPADRGIRAAGYQVLFAYLASQDLRLTVREVGALAGVSRQAALEMRDRMVAEGYLIESTSGLRWDTRRRDDALRRWLEGYRATVRPRLLHGTFRTRRREPDEIAAMIESIGGPPGDRWRWGGSAAAYELRRHYRGERTVIHIREGVDDFVRTLPVLRATDGNLIVMSSFGELNWHEEYGGTTVDPLLVYSELLVDDDERAREAAADLFEELIRKAWRP